MTSEIEECLPLWDGMTYNYRNPTSDVVRLCRFDHGMMGVDLFEQTWAESFDLSQRYVKALTQSCFHSHTLSLPCFTPDHASFVYKNTRMKAEFEAEEKLYKRIRESMSKMSAKHKEMLQKLVDDPTSMSLQSVPTSVRRYKRLVVKMKKVKREPWKYPAGRLSTIRIQDKDLIIHAGGKEMNRLKKIILDDRLDQDSIVNQLASKGMTTFENDGPILEIDTTCVFNDDTISCAVRTDKTCHYGIISQNFKFKKIESMKSEDKLTCVKCNPFIVGEVLCTNEKGFVILRNIEAHENISRQIEANIDSPFVDSWFGCCMGSHPRCIIACSRNSVYLFDLRRSNPKSFRLFNQPNHYLEERERVYCVTAYPSVDTLHLITTNSSVLLMDDRFATQPLLKWSHLLDTPPNICRVHSLPDGISKLILLGNTSNQQIATIHVNQETSDLSGIYSNCSCLHLSNPTDFTEELSKRGRIKITPAKRRLSAPVIGFDAVSRPNSIDTTSIFELTLAGDIFHQNVRHLGNCQDEDDILNRSLSDDTVVELQKWISNVAVDSFDIERKLRKPKDLVDCTSTVKMADSHGQICDCYECNGRNSYDYRRYSVFKNPQSIKMLAECGVQRIPYEDYGDKMSVALVHNWTSNDEIKLAYDKNIVNTTSSQNDLY